MLLILFVVIACYCIILLVDDVIVVVLVVLLVLLVLVPLVGPPPPGGEPYPVSCQFGARPVVGDSPLHNYERLNNHTLTRDVPLPVLRALPMVFAAESKDTALSQPLTQNSRSDWAIEETPKVV